MYLCMHACMHACMYVCMYVCVRACVRMYIYTGIHAYAHRRKHRHRQVHIHLQTRTHVCTHAHTHMHIHAFMHTPARVICSARWRLSDRATLPVLHRQALRQCALYVSAVELGESAAVAQAHEPPAVGSLATLPTQPCQHSFRACHARHGTRVSEAALRRTRQYSRRYSTTTRPRSPARCRTTSATSTSAGLREYSSSPAAMLVQAQQRAVGSEAARVEPRRAPTAIWIRQRLNTFVLIQRVQ